MVIKFDITDLEINLNYEFQFNHRKEWYFKNAKIPIDKKIEDLTDDDKIKLVKLAAYEGSFDKEDILEADSKQFKIKQ